jgi:hypothetical protein
LETFSGSFTVSTTAIDDDPSRCQIAIESGEFTAGSFQLPDGRVSGLNTYTFGPDNASSGTLDLTTGKYTASARGTISNDLYPELATAGTYRGTVDFAAGTLTIDTTTLDDLGPDADPVPHPIPVDAN